MLQFSLGHRAVNSGTPLYKSLPVVLYLPSNLSTMKWSRSPSTQLRGSHVQHAYAAVYVLLLSWENDDLGVRTEIDQSASVFGQAYGYLVERSLIPDKEPDQALEKTLTSFVKRFESPRSLPIVYYGGHGALNGTWSS